MDKLNQIYMANPLYEADAYKLAHKAMLAPHTTREAWNWIPRSLKYMHPSIKKIMSSHQQMVWRYIHSHFTQLFFNKPIEEAHKFGRDMAAALMQPYNADHFIALHKLGFLPVRIQALEEGIMTNPNIPHMSGINTIDGYDWLGLFLETLVSKLAWQGPTVATYAHQFKKNAVEWVTKTDSENLWLADFMCHDFHSRGGNPFTSIAAGLGHVIGGNLGSDTLNVIPASRYYYDFDENETPIYSVNASEHSVTCTGIFYYDKKLKAGELDHEIEAYYAHSAPSSGDVTFPDYLAIAEMLNLRDWLAKFPTAILSVVSDTMDLFKVLTHILPRLKDQIMARDGKLVIRPDSGDPVLITTGYKKEEIKEVRGGKYYLNPKKNVINPETDKMLTENEIKGVVQLLYELFGGTKSNERYIKLDSHIGMIYGDSINLDRQIQIYQRLADNNFATTNVVLGVGSFSYVYMTRDQAGYAAKGCWFETLEDGKREQFNIYKDPATDDGTKKSLKGFSFVSLNSEGEYEIETEVSEEKAFSSGNLLKVIYEDGRFHNQTTLAQIKARLITTY